MSRRDGRVVLAILALVAAGCAPKTVKPPTFAGAIANQNPHERLRQDLRAIFSERTVDHGVWSVAVHSLQRGETLYSSNSFRMQTPASSQKLLTTAAAAERLGWDYRYSTRIYSTGIVDAEGTLNGDLIVVSDGDPTINPRHPQRWGVFDEWGKQLAAKGIKTITGHLIGDDNAFEEPGLSLGWAWDDLAYGYGAAASALQYHENQVELTIIPGQAAGDRATISVSPPGSGLTIDHRVSTADAGQPNRISLARAPGSNMLVVTGQVAAGAPAVTEFAAVVNPTQAYLNAMRVAFLRHGVNLHRTPLDIDELPTAPPDMSKATLLVEDKSPAIAEIIDVTLKWSRNLYAETLLRSMSPAGQPATAAGGLAAMEETLRKFGIFREFYLARDGSGLSRYDYLSTDALVWLLTYLWMDPAHAERYRSTLPVSGESGTLANRLRDTPGAGRVWAKTGSMSQVRSLAGFIVTSAGEPLVFAFMVNGFRVPSAEIDAAMDRALLRLIAFEHTIHD